MARVAELERKFQTEEALPLLIVWERPEGINAETRRAVASRVDQIRGVLAAIAPIVGTARIASATAEIVDALERVGALR